MRDLAREGFARLMAEIDQLEESVERLQERLRGASEAGDRRDRAAGQRELRALLERLEEKRVELTRISNACRRPHSNV